MEILDKLKKEELEELYYLLQQGHFEKIVRNKLEKFKNSNKVCPVCNTETKEDEGLTIIFGSPNMRQKATFDGVDCLEYFLTKLK